MNKVIPMNKAMQIKTNRNEQTDIKLRQMNKPRQMRTDQYKHE